MKLLFEDLTYKIIGCCFEVHKVLGKGFNEIVYKDALEIEFSKNQILFNKEKKLKLNIKDLLCRIIIMQTLL